MTFDNLKYYVLICILFIDVGRMSSVHVSVRSLPRCEEIPRVTCPHNVVTSPQLSPIPSCASPSSSSESPTNTSSPVPSPSSEAASLEDASKLSMAGALEWKENHESETDLRKTLVRSRLNAASNTASTTECQLPRSDSMDSMLGDSLLDPPQSLQKIPPKRYQSPSRCGSPSLEAPDHLLFGSSKNASSAGEICFYLSFK